MICEPVETLDPSSRQWKKEKPKIL